MESKAAFWARFLDCIHPAGEGFGRKLYASGDAANRAPGWPGDIALRFVNTTELAGIGQGVDLEQLRKIANDASALAILIDWARVLRGLHVRGVRGRFLLLTAAAAIAVSTLAIVFGPGAYLVAWLNAIGVEFEF